MARKTQKYYDLLYSAQGKDYLAEASALATLIQSNHSNARAVLDVGCGTGRHARILRDRFNFYVDGIDLDDDMIAIATNENVDGDFSVADMTEFSLGKQYDVITSMFSAIGYVKTKENVVKALSCFKKHLNEDGIVIVEPWLTPDAFSGGKTFMHTAEDREVKICRMAWNERIGNVSKLNFHWTVCTAEGIETFEEKYELGLFTVDEMLSCFKDAGLKATHDSAEGQFANRGIYIAHL